jgi:hypothetical protein
VIRVFLPVHEHASQFQKNQAVWELSNPRDWYIKDGCLVISIPENKKVYYKVFAKGFWTGMETFPNDSE